MQVKSIPGHDWPIGVWTLPGSVLTDGYGPLLVDQPGLHLPVIMVVFWQISRACAWSYSVKMFSAAPVAWLLTYVLTKELTDLLWEGRLKAYQLFYAQISTQITLNRIFSNLNKLFFLFYFSDWPIVKNISGQLHRLFYLYLLYFANYSIFITAFLCRNEKCIIFRVFIYIFNRLEWLVMWATASVCT